MRDCDLGGLQAFGQESRDGRIHGGGFPADDALYRAVDIGDDDIALDGFEDAFHLGQWRRDGGHAAVVIGGDFGHFLAAGADHLQGFGQVQDAGSHQGGVFAQAVPDDQVGLESVLGQHPQDRNVHCQHGRLGDLGAAQSQFRLGDGVFLPIHKNVTGDGPAQDGGHDRVGFTEGFGHQRFDRAQVTQHVDVLRALPGEQEGHLAGLPAAAVDALHTQGLPAGGSVGFEGLEGFFGARDEFLQVLVIDHQPFRLADLLRSWAGIFGQVRQLGVVEDLCQGQAQFRGRLAPRKSRPR